MLFFISLNLNAQRYDFAASSGTFTPITGATNVDAIETYNVLSGEITFPDGFQFNYFGTNYTSFKVSSNGFITFNNSITDSYSNNYYKQNKFIAPLWDNLKGIGGQASYTLTGTSPNRVFTMEWLNWYWNSNASSAVISFQVHLHENGTIEFTYRQESGSLQYPSASIGITGNSSDYYYCLKNSSASPSISPTWVNNINTKPANGQTYTFTPNPLVIEEPTVQASNITTVIETNNANLSWNNGNGEYRVVFVKQTSDEEDVSLTNGTLYYPNTRYGRGNSVSGWYCVYNGTGSNVIVSNLFSGYDYRVKVIEYNGLSGNQTYCTSSVTTNPLKITTNLVTPSNPPSTISLKYKSSDKIIFSIEKGDGDKVAVFMKEATSGTSSPENNTTYEGSYTFGEGSQLGSSGWYCVYSGFSRISGPPRAKPPMNSIFTVDGLSENTEYMIHVVDYNGTEGSEKYNSTSVDQNPVKVKTFHKRTKTYDFSASKGTFTPLSEGTNLDGLEDDDELEKIPIGFTFTFANNEFTEAMVSSNGWLSFNVYEESSYTSNELESTLAKPLLAPLWDDLDGEAGAASYKTTGTAPDRVFTMEWLNWQWRYTASATGISFQVKLYEKTGKIEYIYRQETGALKEPNASIGLSFSETGSGNFISLTNSSASPGFSMINEYTQIDTKPVTGQIYTFVPKEKQTITFTELQVKNIDDPDFDLTATSTSGLAISFTSSNTSVATVSGNIVSIVGLGKTSIIASQPGNETYGAAPDVEQTLLITNLVSQEINFQSIADKTIGDASFNISASATSGLDVSFSTTSEKIELDGTKVSLKKAGSVTIKASQEGDDTYNPALSVNNTFCIKPVNPVITATGLNTDAPVLTSNVETGNQWYKNNIAIEGATGKTYNPEGSGTYTLTVQVDGCESDASSAETHYATGIEDETVISTIEIYPNPVQDILTITLPDYEEAEIAIINTSGEILKKVKTRGAVKLDISNLNAEIYIVNIYTKDGVISRKINKI